MHTTKKPSLSAPRCARTNLRRNVEWRSTTEGAVRCCVPLASPNQPQTNPEGDGEEPNGCSDMTGSGVRSKRMVSNVGLSNEMRTVSEHDGWRKRNVRVIDESTTSTGEDPKLATMDQQHGQSRLARRNLAHIANPCFFFFFGAGGHGHLLLNVGVAEWPGCMITR